MELSDVICATAANDYYQSYTQVCMGDSGGPLFIDHKFMEEVSEGQLLERNFHVQAAISVFTDTHCKYNVNGFVILADYLGWMKKVLGPELFAPIDQAVLPSREHIENQKHVMVEEEINGSGELADLNHKTVFKLIDYIRQKSENDIEYDYSMHNYLEELIKGGLHENTVPLNQP